jgi:hypothetical protein
MYSRPIAAQIRARRNGRCQQTFKYWVEYIDQHGEIQLIGCNTPLKLDAVLKMIKTLGGKQVRINAEQSFDAAKLQDAIRCMEIMGGEVFRNDAFNLVYRSSPDRDWSQTTVYKFIESYERMLEKEQVSCQI